MKINFLLILFALSAFSSCKEPVVHPDSGAVRTDSGIVVTGTDSTRITLSGRALQEFKKRVAFFEIPLEEYWFDVELSRPMIHMPKIPNGIEYYSPEHNAFIDSVEKEYENVPDVVFIGAIGGSDIKEEYIKHNSHDCFDTQFNIPHTFCDYWTFIIVTDQDGKTLALEDTLNQAMYN